MKKLLSLFLLTAALGCNAQNYIGNYLTARQGLRLSDWTINNFQRDTNFTSNYKVPTSLAIKTWVEWRLSQIGGAGSETDPQFDTKFSGKNSDNLAEGSANLYYTNFRSRNALSANPPIIYDPFTGLSYLDTISNIGAATRYRLYKLVDSILNLVPLQVVSTDMYGLGSLKGGVAPIVQGLLGGKLPRVANIGSTTTARLTYNPSYTNPDGGHWGLDSTDYASLAFVTSNFIPSYLYAGLELKANKATNFSTLDNTLYPTTQAVANYLAANYAPVLRNITFVTSSPYTIQPNDYYLVLNSGSAAINLPNPTTNSGREITIDVQKFYGSQGGSITFDKYVYVANDGSVTDSVTSQPTYTTARYRSNGTKWVKVEGSYQFNIATAGGTGVSMVTTSSNVGTSANGALSIAAIKRLKQGTGIQINDLGTGDVEIVNLGGVGGGSDSAKLYFQWPLQTPNDSTVKMNQADATHDGYLDSLAYAGFDSVRTAYNNGTIVKTTATQTLTNKTITHPIIQYIDRASGNYVGVPDITGMLSANVSQSVTSNATLTPTGDAWDNRMYVTALATNTTIAAPSGTAGEGNTILIRIKDDGTARTLTWNSIYRASTDFALPTTTTAGKAMYVQFVYNNAATKWDAIGLTNGF